MATRTISTKLAIEGENEYRQSVANINNSLKTLKSELALVESQFRGNANSQDALKAKGDVLDKQLAVQEQKLNETKAALENAQKAQEKYAATVADYSAKIASAEQKLEALKTSTGDTTEEQKKLNEEISAYKEEQAKAQSYQTAAQRGVEDWQRKVNYAQRDLNNLNGKIEENNKYLGECTRKTNYCATSIDEYGKKTNQAAKELKNANEVMNAMAAALASAGIARGIGEIKDALEACVDASKDFESAMSSVKALSGASAEEFQQLSDMAKRMGETTKYTASESADAFGYMALAGWNTQEMLSGIEPILKLATAASMDLGQASDIVTDYLTAFGLTAQDASKFVDQMAYAMANSNTDVTQLGEAYKNCAATANSLGYSVEDTTAVLMTMANAGVKGGEAGTALNAVMTRLATDTKGCATALSEYGVNVYDAQGNMQSLASILNGVSEAWGTLTDEQQASLAKTIAGTNQYSAFQTIMNGCGEAAAKTGQSFNDYASALENCSGAAGKMADTMLDNLNGKLTLMGSAFDSLKIAIGDTLSPALKELADAGTDAFSWASDFVEQNPWLVQALAGATTAIVTFSAAITGLTVINKLTHMVEGATGALNALQIVLAAHPAVAVATAVSGLVVALGSFIAYAKQASEENRDFLNSLEESKKAFEETTDSIQKGSDDTLSMVTALENLMAVEVKSTAQKQAMADLVNQLNEAVPDLSLAYDAQTDSLNLTAEAIRNVAKARAEEQLREAEIQRLSDLYVEQAQISTDLAAAQYQLQEAQAELNTMTEAGTYGAMGYEAETAAAEQAVLSAQIAVSELTAAQSENQDAVEALEGKYDDAQASIEDTGAAAADTAQQVEDLTAASDGLTEKTKSLADEVDMLSTALQEQQEKGSLSLNTTLELIDAGYAAALSINEETGAITLNKEAYIEIAKAKLDEQITSLQTQQTSIQTAIQLKQEAMTALTDAWAYAELKKAKDELEGLEGQSKAYEAQIAALEKLKSSLGSVTTATKATVSSSKQAKTQAEKDLATYKELKATLDHEKAMDEVSEREYYAKLKEYRDQYLTADDNLDEYRKITEQIYSYDKSLVDKETALWEEQTKSLVSELEGRVKAVMDQQSRMEQSLSGYGDLFKVDDGKMSLESIQDQIDAINAYEEALDGLKDRDISDSLMEKVLGMDVDEATQYAQQLISMTEDQWEQYNTLWEEKQRRAVEVAEKFYQDQLDTLKTEYDDKLGKALSELTDTAFTSGQDTAQGLIDGLAAKESALYAKAKNMADEVSRILSEAYAASGDVDGSHAAGLAYVPYDGYIAELHQGERVLTAKEAQAYVARSMPNSYEPPRESSAQQALGSMLVQAVNAIGTLQSGNSFPDEITFTLKSEDGTTFGRWLVPYVRSEAKSNPEVVSDKL